MNEDYDEELLTDITPDVLRVLNNHSFFARLDDLFCPADGSSPAAVCHGNFQSSTALLVDLGFEAVPIADVHEVLHYLGGCCDCEVLYNVAEESRLKAKYWRARASGSAAPAKDSQMNS